MSEALLFFTGNRNPSITQTITSGGSAVDLTNCTVEFNQRPMGGTAVTGGSAVIVNATSGDVRYDWGTSDVVDPGYRLVWWTVTNGGRTQDENEAVIEWRDHIPTTEASGQPTYVELEAFKSSVELTGTSYADADIQRALLAASRGVEAACHRRFWLDADATQVRYYTPSSYQRLMIDDLAVLTSLAIDRPGVGAWSEPWTLNTHFVLEPANAVANFQPYESLLRRRLSGYTFPAGVENSVKVTGQFGWLEVPAEIEQAVVIIANKLVRRTREATFGIVVVGAGIDNQSAIRLAKHDPDVVPLLADYVKSQPFA